jgi:hypothetical protein
LDQPAQRTRGARASTIPIGPGIFRFSAGLLRADELDGGGPAKVL